MKENHALVFKDPRKEKHGLLDQILKHCYCDAETGLFHCKKGKCTVYVDFSRNYAFCAVHGTL